MPTSQGHAVCVAYCTLCMPPASPSQPPPPTPPPPSPPAAVYVTLQNENCNTYPYDANNDDDYPDYPILTPTTEPNAQACMDACTAYTFFGGCNMVTYSTSATNNCQKHRFGTDGGSLHLNSDCAADTSYDTYVRDTITVVDDRPVPCRTETQTCGAAGYDCCSGLACETEEDNADNSYGAFAVDRCVSACIQLGSGCNDADAVVHNGVSYASDALCNLAALRCAGHAYSMECVGLAGSRTCDHDRRARQLLESGNATMDERDGRRLGEDPRQECIDACPFF